MKQKSINRIFGIPNRPSLALVTAITAFASSAHSATYQWNGSTGNWQTATNWSSTTTQPFNTSGTVPVFNNDSGSDTVHRLNVNGATTLLYTAAEGSTLYGNTATSSRGLVIGSGSSGTMTITGGTFSTVGSTAPDVIGNGNGFTGTLTIDGGSYVGTAAGTGMGIAGGPTSNLNILSGSATVATLSLNNTTGTINLDGGTLAANNFTRANGNNTINFNGGTLKPLVSGTTFLPDLAATNAYVKSGGAIVDTDGFNITIAEPLLAHGTSTGGGITKNGSGVLTLGAVSTTTGPAVVNDGGLGVAFGASSWTPSGFTHSGGQLSFNIGLYNPGNAVAINTPALTLNSTDITVNISGIGLPSSGQIKLLDYGTKSGSGSIAATPGSLPPGVSATIEENTTEGYYYLNILPPTGTALVWSAGTGDWDTVTKNWNTNNDLYSEPALVTFPDLAGGGVVTLTADRSPASFEINNNTGNDYTFNGPGTIPGACTSSLLKNGTGSATFATPASYSGNTTVNGGKLTLSSMSNSPAYNVTNGATLEINRLTDQNYNIKNVLIYGTGKFVKSGPGLLMVNRWQDEADRSAEIALAGESEIRVEGGTLRLGDYNINWNCANNLADLSIAAGATVDGYGSTISVDALTGSGTYVAGYYGPRALNVGVNGGSGTFSGVIKSNKVNADINSEVQFIKRGNGSQTLDGVLAIRGSYGSTSLEVRGGISGSPSILTISPAAATAQVETLSNAGTITTAGNATATVRATGLSGSPLAIPFAVALDDTPEMWSQKMRAALSANAAVTAMFSVGGTGADVVLTRLVTDICDFNLNLSVANAATGGSVGITARNSTNTATGASVIGYTGGDLLLSPGNNDVTEVNQTSGTLIGGQLAIGQFGQGTYNFTGGVVNAGRVEFAWNGGGNNGEAVMNISGSARLNVNSNGQILMGQYWGRPVTVNQTGGEVIQFSDTGVTRGGTGKMNFNGGNQNLTWNLSGGTLSIAGIGWAAPGGGAGGGNGILNLNGGILQITNAAFAAPTGDANGKPKVAAKALGDDLTPNSGARFDNFGLAVTFAAPIQHGGTGVFDGGLSLATSLPGGSLTLSGVNTYTGDTIVPAANTLILADNAELFFLVDTLDATKLTGAGTATLKGEFRIDTTYADLTDGNSWTLVDVTNRSFDPVTFSVVGFTETNDVWKKTDGTNTWTFTESDGKLTLGVSPLTGYPAWIDDFTVGDAAADADPDNDGMENLLEYVLNGDPTKSDPAILPDVDAVTDPLYLVFTFTRREESANDTTQVFEYGSSLTGWTQVSITGAPGGEVTIGAAVGGLQAVTVKIPKTAASGGKLFGRLKTTQP